MSTTMVPPSEFVIESPGRRPRAYRTIEGLAAGVMISRHVPGAISVRTGSRHRRLHGREREELERQLRGYRLLLGRADQGDASALQPGWDRAPVTW